MSKHGSPQATFRLSEPGVTRFAPTKKNKKIASALVTLFNVIGQMLVKQLKVPSFGTACTFFKQGKGRSTRFLVDLSCFL